MMDDEDEPQEPYVEEYEPADYPDWREQEV